ncbi:MAG: alcohol dehydrogenase catalytic domain-containing protein [Planctomycetes bacterium]|nr:alcohol dehydrogenase catalytic domain-containing protein [Planctomycetota bacterium]
MKAMVLTGIRKMEMREVPEPVMRSDNDVLIRVKRVGVCGSDVHYYTAGRIGSQVVQYPYRVGHECSGVVEQVGSAVRNVKPGDRIAVEPAQSCFKCDQCRMGRVNTCRNLSFLGTPGQGDGCLCEWLVMPSECCFPVPQSLSLDEAALVEPLSIGVYSVRQSVPMKGAKVGILGVGPIGLSCLIPARQAGAATVYVTDRIDRRLAAARGAGADWTGNPDTSDIVAGIARAEPGLLDVVFECCGRQEALDQAIDILRPGGTLMLVGIPPVDRVSFSIDQIRRKEITLRNVRRQAHCVQPAIDLAAGSDVDLGFMLTHRFPFEKSAEAFDLVDQYRDGVIKAMITLD